MTTAIRVCLGGNCRLPFGHKGPHLGNSKWRKGTKRGYGSWIRSTKIEEKPREVIIADKIRETTGEMKPYTSKKWDIAAFKEPKSFDLEHPLHHCCECGSEQKIDFSRYVDDAAAKKRLTDRETDVLRLMFKGLATIEIARACGLGEKTIKHHISAIFHKFGAKSKYEIFNMVFPT